MGWILTLGLQNLRRQVNAAFPARDITSDGTIGDTAHQAETSGHNRDDTPGSRPEWDGDPDSTPEVRAWDMDSNLNAPPATAQQVVDHIRRLPGVSSVLRYMIYNRKIYRASNDWVPETYTGKSAHTEHIHFSGAYTQAADDNVTFDFRLDEVGDNDMTKDEMLALLRSEDGKRAIGQAVFQYDPGYVDGDPAKGVWPGIPDTTYGPGGNGTVSLGTAIGSLLSRQRDYGAADAAAAQTITSALSAVVPAIAAAVLAGLPQGADQISQDEVTEAVKAAFAQAFGQPSTPAA